MDIRLNGETQAVRDGVSVAELLESMGIGERRVAVELNLDLVPRASFPTTRLTAGDVVEVVQFVGGG